MGNVLLVQADGIVLVGSWSREILQAAELGLQHKG